MKKIFFVAFSVACTTFSYAQKQINAAEAAKHEGESVTVCTKIFGGKYFENSPKKQTLLDAGARYPNALLKIVILGEDRGNFSNKPEEFYVNKEVCVTGKIIIYKGKPEIEIKDETAIKIN